MTDPVFNYTSINPFGLIKVGVNYASPTFADIDDDNDLDAFIGNIEGNTIFFKNTGTINNPVFATAVTNPFGLNDVGWSAIPTLVDIDGDGDLDAFVGETYGNTRFFKNIGTISNPQFAAAVTNPFGLSDVANNASPTLVDIDGDSDLDAFIGNTNNILFFRNTGTAINPIFATPVTNPFGFFGMNGYGINPTFVDIEGDGDLDAFVGWSGTYSESDGTLFFRNIGTTNNPVFYNDSMNPFGLGSVGRYWDKPVFVDINGDSDLDAFIGDSQGNTVFFQGTGKGVTPHFSGGFFGLSSTSYNPHPTFVDIDGDGDLDAFVGKGYSYYDNGAGDTLFYENKGTAENSLFAPAITNPFGITNTGSFASPSFVDIDGDGDFDAFVGEGSGNILYFSNAGTSSTPAFTTGVVNPFGLNNVGKSANPTFADIDNDGDYDAFVNDVFFRNTGTVLSPIFAAPEIDPFGLGSNPRFLDFDDDGDLDTLNFRNIGTANNPTFTPLGSSFGLPQPVYRSGFTSLTPVDIDGDGDLDVYATGIYSYNRDFAWDGFFYNDNAPNAFNLTIPEVYIKNTPLNLTDIVISDPDSENVTATLTLSNSSAGSLSTATSGTVTSVYNAGTGVWKASGALIDVNALLAGVIFTPSANFTDAFKINTSISGVLLGSKSFSVLQVNTAGNDIFNGTSFDNDTVTYANATVAVTISLLTNAPQNTIGGGLDTFNSIENLIGSPFNDNLTGNTLSNVLDGKAGNDTLRGWSGADTMIGGLGNDTFYVENTKDVVTEKLNEGTDTISSTVTYTLPLNVENLILTGTAPINGTGNAQNNIITGNSAANQLNGNDGNDTLNGGAGNDTLIGWTGADTMIGGLGDDTYFVENAGDVVNENLNQGNDTVSSRLTYALPINVENLILTGTSAINGNGNTQANFITGNGAVNEINGDAGNDTIDGGAGNDTLIGWSGADTMTGGLGNDNFFVENIGDVVIENLNQGIDTVSSNLTYLLPVNVENLTLIGAAVINGTGNGQANNILGNAAINQLNGGAGNDTLDGKGGNNILTGGTGNDIFKFTTNGHIDQITDYSVLNDTIQLENGVFTALTTPGIVAATQFRIGPKALDHNDFIIYNKTAGTLLYDSDGNGAVAATQIATVGSGLNLTNADIMVI